MPWAWGFGPLGPGVFCACGGGAAEDKEDVCIAGEGTDSTVGEGVEVLLSPRKSALMSIFGLGGAGEVEAVVGVGATDVEVDAANEEPPAAAPIFSIRWKRTRCCVNGTKRGNHSRMYRSGRLSRWGRRWCLFVIDKVAHRPEAEPYAAG